MGGKTAFRKDLTNYFPSAEGPKFHRSHENPTSNPQVKLQQTDLPQIYQYFYSE